MSRLSIVTKDKAQVAIEGLYSDLERRIVASPPGLCYVDLINSFVKMCLAQSCGKCVPCRIGLAQVSNMLEDVLNGKATEETIELIKQTAESIYESADCAIGFETARAVLNCVKGCREDFESHVKTQHCTCNSNQPVRACYYAGKPCAVCQRQKQTAKGHPRSGSDQQRLLDQRLRPYLC